MELAKVAGDTDKISKRISDSTGDSVNEQYSSEQEGKVASVGSTSGADIGLEAEGTEKMTEIAGDNKSGETHSEWETGIVV